MESEIQQIFGLVGDAKAAYIAGGVFALAATVVKILVEVWSKWEWLQSYLPEKYQWENLGPWAKRGVVLLGSILASLLTALGSGLTLKAALLATIPASIPLALAALGIHSGSKKAGSVIDDRQAQKTEKLAGSGKDPSYEPSPYRKVMDPIIPIDWSKYPQSAKMKAVTEELGKRYESPAP